MLSPLCVLICSRQAGSWRQAVGWELGRRKPTVHESVRASHDSQSQTTGPNKQRASEQAKAQSCALSRERENRETGESSGIGWHSMQRLPERVMSLARFQRNAAPSKGRERYWWILKKQNKNCALIFLSASHVMLCCRCCHRKNYCCLLFGTDLWISCLFYLSLRAYWTTAQFEVEIERDEEAFVMLTIFTNQYPFMLLLLVCLAEVSPAVTQSFLFSVSVPSFVLPCCYFLPLYFTHAIQRVCTSWEVHAVPLRAALKEWTIQR